MEYFCSILPKAILIFASLPLLGYLIDVASYLAFGHVIFTELQDHNPILDALIFLVALACKETIRLRASLKV